MVGTPAAPSQAANTSLSCTTTARPPRLTSTLTWIISGEKGRLHLEGNGVSVLITPPKQYQNKNASAEAHHFYQQPKGRSGRRRRLGLGLGGFGGVGDWYHAYVRGDKDGFVRFQASDG